MRLMVQAPPGPPGRWFKFPEKVRRFFAEQHAAATVIAGAQRLPPTEAEFRAQLIEAFELGWTRRDEMAAYVELAADLLRQVKGEPPRRGDSLAELAALFPEKGTSRRSRVGPAQVDRPARSRLPTRPQSATPRHLPARPRRVKR